MADLNSSNPVRVCSQCYYGQEIVCLQFNDMLGESYGQIQAGDYLESIVACESEDADLGFDLRSYGPIEIAHINPLFVLRTRRANKDRVFVNVCICDRVPYNEDFKVGGRRVMYFVCSSMRHGATVQVNHSSSVDSKILRERYTVYDIVMNPKEAEAILNKEPQSDAVKTEICEQALICISSLTSERDFVSYQWENDVLYKQPFEEDKAPSDTTDATKLFPPVDEQNGSPVMAIPSPSAFQDVLQCCTQLSDFSPASEENEIGSLRMVDKTRVSMHRDRIIRRLSAASTNNKRTDCLPNDGEPSNEISTVFNPYPGFVIKTRKVSDVLKKVFVNVYHHESIDDLSKNAGCNVGPSDLITWVGSISDVSDKEGVVSLLYHVVVSSKFFLESFLHSSVKITDHACIIEILSTLNSYFQDDLDRDSYVLPRVKGGFKGEWMADKMKFVYCAPNVVDPNGSTSQEEVIPNPPISERRTSNAGDSDSVISDITNTTTSSVFTVTRKSILDVFYPQKHRPSIGGILRKSDELENNVNPSRNLRPTNQELTNSCAVTADMLQLNRTLNLDLKGALDLKQLSVSDPSVLIGWQVTLFDKNNKPDIYVITGARKNHLRKMEYRLSNFEKGDWWVRLKRSEKKHGLPFTINRRVMSANAG